jgi:hypothetical protein
LGVIGWHLTTPSLDLVEIVYRSLSLFALNFDADDPPHWTLNLARFIAAGVTYAAVFTVLSSLLAERLALANAMGAHHHSVILGDGPEAAQIALRLNTGGSGRHRVVVVGDLSEETSALIRRPGVVHVRAASDAALARILKRATRVVVTGPSDEAAVALARKAADYRSADTPMTVLFTGREVAEYWGRFDAHYPLCRPAQVAAKVLLENPPYDVNAMAPPPIVLGDGAMAAEIVRRLATGGYQPAEVTKIVGIGMASQWREVAVAGVEGCADFAWVDARLQPGSVGRLVAAAIADWPTPDPDRFATVGPSIYVACPADAEGIPLAAATAEAFGDARVVCLVNDAAAWGGAQSATSSNLRLVSVAEVLSDPEVLCLNRSALLQREIRVEVRTWPGDPVAALGGAAVSDISAGDRVVAAVAAAVARDVTQILAAGGVGIEGERSNAQALVLVNPTGLVAMEQELAAVSRSAEGFVVDVSEDGRCRRLEFASRLPTLVARSGWSLVRSNASEFDADAVDRLARRTHEVYLVISRKTENATGSANADTPWEKLSELDQRSNYAQVLDIPVKLAMVNLTWRRSDEPRIREFDDDTIERLAQLEHRRWQHFQLRNGRAAHQCNIAFWDPDPEVPQLTPDQREYDRKMMRDLPGALASVGLEIIDLS